MGSALGWVGLVDGGALPCKNERRLMGRSVGPSPRFDSACGADHYDQLKIEHGKDPKIAHVYSGYRHPFKQHASEE